MMRTLFVFFLALLATAANAQEGPTLPQTQTITYAKPGKRANVILHAMDGTRIRGRVHSIGYDYVIIDAAGHTSVADLNKYYIRPYDNYYKIDVQYLTKASVNKGRILGQSALNWGIAGATIFGIAGYKTAESNNDGDFFAALGGGAVGAGVGLTAGGFVGSLVGLMKRKRVYINGNPANLDKLRKYFDAG